MDKDQPIEVKSSEPIPVAQPVQAQPINSQIENAIEFTNTEPVEVMQPIISSQQPTQPTTQDKPDIALTTPVAGAANLAENYNLITPSLQNQQQPTIPQPARDNNIALIISVVILLAIAGVFVYLLFFAKHKTNLDNVNKQSANSIRTSKQSEPEKTVANEKLNPINSITSASANSYIAGNSGNIKSGWKQVSVGEAASCGISFDDKLYCWGGSLSGTFEADLGVSRELDQSTQPVAVVLSNGLDKEKIKKVVNGYGGSCVTTESGKLYCWGYNPSWGYGGWPKTFEGTFTPFVFDGAGVFKDKKINDIFLNSNGGCAISSDGVIYCWGYMNGSQKTAKPVAINTSGLLKDKTITSVESRASTTCATTDDQKIYCWYNFYGDTVQSAEKIESLTPIEINTDGKLVGQKISKLSIGRDFVCVLTQSSNIYCWGSGSGGELGNGKKLNSKKLVQVENSGVLKDVKIVSITSGESHSCVLSDAGKTYCWGDNYYGELGNGTVTDSFVPTAVSMSGKQFVSVISYSDYTCAIDDTNQFYCWGRRKDVDYSKNIDDIIYKVPVKMF